jgi:Domain of unknown function (DUF4384)
MIRATLRRQISTCALALFLSRAAAADTFRAAQIEVEAWRGETWQAVDSQTVFHAGDRVRFRFRVSSPGHLYVLNISENGDGSWLFPTPGKGQSSRVEAGTSYTIPADNAWFVIGGNPGYDVTYWIVTPTSVNVQSPDTPVSKPSTLVPRCQEGPLRARGLCLDADAGARPLDKSRRLPIEWKGSAPSLQSRELKFESAERGTTVRAPASAEGAMIYEFRIAHQ